jgi:DedD protein|tara:strand:- start:4317 stop:4925 length:609 start_codon:yes stop_codon:yes gene_type:complete
LSPKPIIIPKEKIVEATVKHRIVGSLILLSLAVIILPFWLDGVGLQEYKTMQQPLIPKASELSLDVASVAVNRIKKLDPSDSEILQLSPIPATDKPPIKSKQTQQAVKQAKLDPNNGVLNAQGLPEGWVVQLGNFGNRANAARLRDKVIKAGFAGYMVPNGDLFKVLVGPELTRPKAEALQEKLKSKFKMAGMVTLYEIEKP